MFFNQINEAFRLTAFWSTLHINVPCLSACKSVCKMMSRIVIFTAKIPKKMNHTQQWRLFLCPFLSTPPPLKLLNLTVHCNHI